jgi:hypothetical protein
VDDAKLSSRGSTCPLGMPVCTSSEGCLYSPSCLDEVFSETGFSGICDFSGTQERPISAKRGISDSTPMASFKSRP